MRLDKFLHDMNVGTRSQIRQLVKTHQIIVNDQVAKTPRLVVDPEVDLVYLNDKKIEYQTYFYYLLNKPLGVLTATKDKHQKTVLDLLNKTDFRDDLFPVGRLDKDTEGLLLITNNGPLSHTLLSPKHHVDKIYEAVVTGVLGDEAVQKFRDGIILKDNTKLKPAELKIKSISGDEKFTTVEVRITEGKYHQVRRMFASLGQKVVSLKRIKMGPLELDDGSIPGTYRELRASEVEALINYQNTFES